MSLTPEERIAFVKNLELGALSRIGNVLATGEDAPTTAAKDGKDESAFVVDGSVVSFVASITGQLKADVLNSTDLAQLAADYKYNRETDIDNWYKYYAHVLSRVGWVVQGSHFDKIENDKLHGSVDKIVIDVARQFLPSDELKLLEATIAALGEPGNAQALQLFNQRSSNTNRTAANFQLGVVENSDGNAVFKLGCFKFSWTPNPVLFFTLDHVSVEFYHSDQTLTLNEHLYGAVRDTVIKKLGNHAKATVAKIDLAKA